MKTPCILFLAAICMLSGCDRAQSNSNYDAEYENQLKRTAAQLDDYDRQTKLADEMQAKMGEQNERMDQFLAKWEEQARRYDEILAAMEKQQGIKK